MTLPPALAWGQTTEELNSDGKNPENVLTQSMGLDRKSYSPLNQINKGNVKRLVPVWTTSTAGCRPGDDGAGSEFSVLPAQNANGNWVKAIFFPYKLKGQALMLTPKQRAMWFEHNEL